MKGNIWKMAMLAMALSAPAAQTAWADKAAAHPTRMERLDARMDAKAEHARAQGREKLARRIERREQRLERRWRQRAARRHMAKHMEKRPPAARRHAPMMNAPMRGHPRAR